MLYVYYTGHKSEKRILSVWEPFRRTLRLSFGSAMVQLSTKNYLWYLEVILDVFCEYESTKIPLLKVSGILKTFKLKYLNLKVSKYAFGLKFRLAMTSRILG